MVTYQPPNSIINGYATVSWEHRCSLEFSTEWGSNPIDVVLNRFLCWVFERIYHIHIEVNNAPIFNNKNKSVNNKKELNGGMYKNKINILNNNKIN